MSPFGPVPPFPVLILCYLTRSPQTLSHLPQGQWQKAICLLAEMPLRGLTPNAVTYGSAVHACVVGAEPRQALALLEEMMERGIAPDAAAFTAGMRAVDGWAAALRLLEAMKRHVSSEREDWGMDTAGGIGGIFFSCGHGRLRRF